MSNRVWIVYDGEKFWFEQYHGERIEADRSNPLIRLVAYEMNVLYEEKLCAEFEQGCLASEMEVWKVVEA